MQRTENEIRSELDAAQALDRTLPMSSPDYKANRARIGALLAELTPYLPKVTGAFDEAAYKKSPDSFQQSARNRKEAA
jgi:hypothetical protein